MHEQLEGKDLGRSFSYKCRYDRPGDSDAIRLKSLGLVAVSQRKPEATFIKMKFVIVIFALIGCGFAQFGNYRGFQNQRPFTQTPRYQQFTEPPQQQYRPQYNPSGPQIAIRSQQQDASPDGSYQWSYDTENGISASESGSPKATPEGQAEVVKGHFSYTAPDGTPINVEYYADENGFHAEGAHLPTPPPIPAAIQRALAVLPQNRQDSDYDQQPQQYNRPAFNQGNPFRKF